MGDRVCSVLGGTDNIVDFEEFVKTLSLFNSREESEEKLKCKVSEEISSFQNLRRG